jgi:hypothetical protein
MDEAMYQRVIRFPLVAILPLVSANSRRPDGVFGIGLARLLIRDLMLVRDISVRGPEDTPEVGLEMVREIVDEMHPGVYVSGQTFVDGDDLCADISILRPGQPSRELRVVENDLNRFVAACAESIARAVGGTVTDETRRRWAYGRPASVESLRRLGQIIGEFNREDVGRGSAAARLYAEDPGLTLAAHMLDKEHTDYRATLLAARDTDPYDAQLCILLFCDVWTSQGYERDAFQFVRRAVELSPGHGKAHMCMPHAAHADVPMIRHSELGYRLLPGNPFAINNYIINLQRGGGSSERLVRLAEEGIASDPYDPTNYDRMIEAFEQSHEYETALKVAMSLQELYEPALHPRTRFCIEQNPVRGEALRLGRLDPAAENRERIEGLRRTIAGGAT